MSSLADNHEQAPSDSRGEELLREAAGSDGQLLATLLERHRAGEPAAYLAGFFRFAGAKFKSDRRAYITDPELVHLVSVVEREAISLESTLGRPPRLLEFGVGAATLSITLKNRHPQWDITGIDIDEEALQLARENANLHGCQLSLFKSDYFSAWTLTRPEPDLIFGDPPWGGPEDLYDETRGASYYEQMPVHSAFPKTGGPSGIHDRLIREATKLHWSSRIALNYGVLPMPVIEASAAPLSLWNLIRAGGNVTVLVGKLRGSAS